MDRVLVTGACGTVGALIVNRYLEKGHTVCAYDHSENGLFQLRQQTNAKHRGKLKLFVGCVRDLDRLVKATQGVDVVFHCAALKHVFIGEYNPFECVHTNVLGTQNVVDACLTNSVGKLIFTSSDKAVNPTNFMGASKRFAEIVCQSLPPVDTKTLFSIVRFGNVLGSSGSVVPLFKKQIKNGGPITLTHLEITRYFMTITEACQLVIQAGSISNGGDIFVLDMGKPVKILELAKRMVTLSGLRPILDSKERLGVDEVAISVTGLRPGEKLFEELTYNSNLTRTIHPQINTSVEMPVNRDRFQALLDNANDAIRNNDYQELYKIISSVTEGVSSLKGSGDLLIKRQD